MAAASPNKAARDDNLRKVFDQYCGFGQGKDKAAAENLESRNYFKLMKESGLVHPKGLTRTDVDLIFTKHKPKGGLPRLDFDTFVKSLADIGQKRFPKTFKEKGADAALKQVVLKLTAVGGPGLAKGVSKPQEVRLHDDKESYTGVHKRGGPSKDDTSGVKLERLLDRSPADARGRHRVRDVENA